MLVLFADVMYNDNMLQSKIWRNDVRSVVYILVTPDLGWVTTTQD